MGNVNFGFQVNDRFISATAFGARNVVDVSPGQGGQNSVGVDMYSVLDAKLQNEEFFIYVY